MCLQRQGPRRHPHQMLEPAQPDLPLCSQLPPEAPREGHSLPDLNRTQRDLQYAGHLGWVEVGAECWAPHTFHTGARLPVPAGPFPPSNPALFQPPPPSETLACLSFVHPQADDKHVSVTSPSPDACWVGGSCSEEWNQSGHTETNSRSCWPSDRNS